VGVRADFLGNHTHNHPDGLGDCTGRRFRDHPGRSPPSQKRCHAQLKAVVEVGCEAVQPTATGSMNPERNGESCRLPSQGGTDRDATTASIRRSVRTERRIWQGAAARTLARDRAGFSPARLSPMGAIARGPRVNSVATLVTAWSSAAPRNPPFAPADRRWAGRSGAPAKLRPGRRVGGAGGPVGSP
jgi:hypothetical protein